MADDPSKDAPHESPVEQDARQPVAGRQPQRPGQPGQYQPRPGERDPETLPSREPEGFAGPDEARGVSPPAQKPRLGQPAGQDVPED
jgi:hypothetical protein